MWVKGAVKLALFEKVMASDGTATVKVRNMGSERTGGVVNVWGYGIKNLVFILSWFSRKTAGGRCLEHQWGRGSCGDEYSRRYNAVCFMHHSSRCFYNTNRGNNGRESY